MQPDATAARRIWHLLAGLAAPFVLETAFELVVLTPRYGPQMLFFSVAHRWHPVALALLGLSALAYALLVPFTLWQLVVISVAPRTGTRWDAILAIALTSHAVALASYAFWAPALFAN